MHLSVEKNSFKLKKTFTISRGSRTCADVLTVKIKDNGFVGWAECVPYKRYNESLETVTQKIAKGIYAGIMRFRRSKEQTMSDN